MKAEKMTDASKHLAEDIATPKPMMVSNQNSFLNKLMEYSTPEKRLFANAETLCNSLND